MIKQAMPTTPLEGLHSARDSTEIVADSGRKLAVAVAEFIVCGSRLDAGSVCELSSFVFPIRIGRMFDVPKRATAFDCGNLSEIIFRWRRGRGPLKSPGIPRIIAGGTAFA